MKTSILSNIWKIYIFRFFRDFYLIIPILVPFYKSFGLSGVQILTVQAVFSLALFLFEVPSGYFADVVGRRQTLMIGALAFPLGLTIYAFGHSFYYFILAETFLGFAFAMCSGTESALIYDTLLEAKKAKTYQKIEGRAEFLTRIGSTAAGFLGGVLGGIMLLLPFYFNILTGIFMFFVALTFLEPSRKKYHSADPLQGILQIVVYSLKHPQILALIVLYAVLMTSGLVAVWGYLFRLQSLALPLYINGIGFALFQIFSAFGALQAHRLSKYLGVERSYFLLLIIPAALLAQAWLGSWILPLALVHSYVWGFSLIFFLERVNRLITSDIRATVLSTGSMIGRLLFVLVAPLFGLLADHYSLTISFVMLSVLFLVFFATATYIRLTRIS